MSPPSKCFAHALGGAALLSLALAASPVHAQRADGGPFAGLAGSWSGGGAISLAGGGSERIRCRATYAVGGGGGTLQMTLRCASDSYNFNVVSNVASEGGAISGSWTETSRNASGSVSGRVSGGQIQARVTGPAFTANMGIATRGNSQSVGIRASGGEVTGVDVTLSRR